MGQDRKFCLGESGDFLEVATLDWVLRNCKGKKGLSAQGKAG